MIFRRFASSQANDQLSINAKKWFDEGLTKWNKEDIQGALECFEKSVLIKPTADAHYNLANCYHSQGKHTKAIVQWKHSVDLVPRADSYCNIANAHALIHGDRVAALPYYEKALKMAPEDGEIHFNFAAVLDADSGDDQSKLEKAVLHYQKARQLGISQADKNLRNALARLAGMKSI